MCDTSLATASVEALAGELDEASEPHKRLPLLLALADGVSTIDARRAMDLAREADALAANLENKSAQGEALYLQGRCADLLLDQATALDVYAKALQAFEAAQDDRAVARTLRAISFIHDTLGNFPRALDYQFQALELDERTGNQGSRAATLRTIGIVYSRSGDPVAGLDYYRKSLALCTQPSDAIERGKTLNNIGINLKNLGQLTEAHEALAEAHGVFVDLGLPLQQSATLNNIGLVQQRLGDAASAERTLRAALDLSEATGYRYGVAHASLSLGKVCMARGAMMRRTRGSPPRSRPASGISWSPRCTNATRRSRNCTKKRAIPLRRSNTSGVSMRSSGKCSPGRRATSCAHSRFSSRWPRPSARPNSSANGRRC